MKKAKPFRTDELRPEYRQYCAIGLMSGTSMDAIDVAVIETDGKELVRFGPFSSRPYPPPLRAVLLKAPADGIDIRAVERELTDVHIERVKDFCTEHSVVLSSIDCIGFHGQTIKHEPQLGRTWQLGDGARMASTLDVTVINKFRHNDMLHGGQGAPMVPAFHRALVQMQHIQQPVALLNIGGVSNVTLIDGEGIYACDCGPGNALIDDWVGKHCGVLYDHGGQIASSGEVDQVALAELMNHPYFRQRGVKSLDRNTFSPSPIERLSVQDGAATLVAFTVEAIAAEAAKLPVVPNRWVVLGGGRLNLALVSGMRARLGATVNIAEDFGWNGDAIEAQAFAYLAVRFLQGLPATWPTTTGVSRPVTGGVRWDRSA